MSILKSILVCSQIQIYNVVLIHTLTYAISYIYQIHTYIYITDPACFLFVEIKKYPSVSVVTCLTLGCDPAPEQSVVPAQAEGRGSDGKRVQNPGNRLSRLPRGRSLQIYFLSVLRIALFSVPLEICLKHSSQTQTADCQ